ncbi:hypothetical protein E2C01_053923 [Portunus trituberculatus]|uniref:Uncharacterized protein n=1 Tax=Portunus trituberculatus TaxID=210409 RepID=A0A5B7GTL3_PORTR|nr:hypothetical protein [Portunus trituberculatus]
MRTGNRGLDGKEEAGMESRDEGWGMARREQEQRDTFKQGTEGRRVGTGVRRAGMGRRCRGGSNTQVRPSLMNR